MNLYSKLYSSLTPAEFCYKFKPSSKFKDFILKYETMAEAWDACENANWLLWAVKELGLAIGRGKKLTGLECRFVRETPIGDGKTFWDARKNPGWLLWIVRKLGIAVGRGKTVWDLLEDERSRKAIETAEAWCKGEASDEELNEAYDDAGIAARAPDATYAADAAYATRPFRDRYDIDVVYSVARAVSIACDAETETDSRAIYKKVNQFQAPLIRETFGNPFFKS